MTRQDWLQKILDLRTETQKHWFLEQPIQAPMARYSLVYFLAKIILNNRWFQ